jgi:pre-rRNA-processing protein TSR3
MQPLVDIVIRHPKERKSKCSLEPLRHRDDIRFLLFRPDFSFDASGLVLLSIDAPVIGESDGEWPLLLLDSTWRLLPAMSRAITGSFRLRSLPNGIRTAYPRSSKISPDPPAGLASVEALYLARRLQSRPTTGILDGYRWRDSFLRQFG